MTRSRSESNALRVAWNVILIIHTLLGSLTVTYPVMSSLATVYSQVALMLTAKSSHLHG